MNRFLQLALTAGLLSPIAAKAESVWLIIQAKSNALEKIQMRDMNQCQTQGEIWKRNSPASSVHYWTCLEGK